jgi:hypothetical protein
MISNILKTDIDRYAEELRAGSRLLTLAKAGGLDTTMVGRYMAGISYMIHHTAVHLTLAKKSALERGEHRLAAYFDEKLREEAGHERWATSDLDKLDVLFGKKIPREPAPGAANLMRCIEAGIESEPYLYLAYILFAEYMVVTLGPEWVAALQECCGIPRDAQTVNTHHIELDKEHVQEGLAEIDALIDDPARYEPLRTMLKDSMQHFSAFCDDVCDVAA